MIDKIINYVEHTPENTNPAVLATLLGDLNKQSDWNQNDDTQLDYVKNRPFYTGDLVETVLVEERTVSFEKDPERDLYSGEFKPTFSATVGETYKVSWDGATYECTCIDDGFPSIGNLSIVGGGSDTGEPFLLRVVQDLVGQDLVRIITADTASSHTISISIIAEEVVKINPKYLPMPFRPKGESYLTFSSPNEFTLSALGRKTWNGTLEYFSSDETWTTWSGENQLSAAGNGGEYVIYLRGIGNSVITGEGVETRWKLIGTDIKCIGNIENLLDYATVESGNHPIMSDACYSGMFRGCTSLTQAPELPATTLTSACYWYMFSGCSLTQAPELPATTLTSNCYQYMFSRCTSLTQIPELPATTLAFCCCERMFWKCRSLKLSSIKTDKYIQEYRTPSSEPGVIVHAALADMFVDTGGTFTRTPEINTTYYLSSDNMIARKTETATLNGYVNSIVDNAIEKYADTGEYIIPSSTEGSTKKFKIIVDDSGAISATEVKQVR